MRWEVIKNLLGKPKVGAEVGVSRGLMTRNMLTLIPSIEKYYCVDPWELTEDYDKLLKSVGASVDYTRVFQEFYHNTKNFQDKIVVLKMVSMAAVRAVEHESLDFVFIDGDHSYKHVKQDIEFWFQKVKPRGLIAGHDYGQKFPGVKQAVDKWLWGLDVQTGDDSTWKSGYT